MDSYCRLSASSMVALVAVLVAVVGGGADAYAFGPSPGNKVRYSPTTTSVKRGIHKRRADGSPVTLYLFPSAPSVSAANHRSRRVRSGHKSGGASKTSLPAMSDSVLSPGDTLPSFHTAHGLLSPEVVMRIADANDLEQDGALHQFLKMYKRNGPMACLPMLSDPDVLPELTRAMRDIA